MNFSDFIKDKSSILIFGLVLLIAIPFSIHWIRDKKETKVGHKRGIFSFVTSTIALFIVTVYLIASYNIENEAIIKHESEKNADAIINMEASNINEAPYLIALNNISADNKPQDIIELFGEAYETIETETDITFRFTDVKELKISKYIPDYIDVKYDLKKEKILTITWITSSMEFDNIYKYLAIDVLKGYKSKSSDSALWSNYSLGKYKDYVSFKRKYK